MDKPELKVGVMIPVSQTLFLQEHSQGNCFNACVASILEKDLNEIPNILPRQKGSWLDKWKVYLADLNLKLVKYDKSNPPHDYAIAVGTIPYEYPSDHPRSGKKITHACITLNGIVVHDPFPIKTKGFEISYFYKIEEMTDKEIACHMKNSFEGFCDHGYLSKCSKCKK